MRARGAPRVQVTTADPKRASGVLESLGLADIQAADGEVSAQIGGHAPEAVNRALVLADVPVARFDTPRPSLEDLFVELTGEGFDVDG